MIFPPCYNNYVMDFTKEPKIKTIELLLIDIIPIAPPENLVLVAFRKTLQHFTDEDFLYSTDHNKILSTIYLNSFYKNHYLLALTQTLHIDRKTLLTCRKNYLRLFAKYYLGIEHNTNLIFPLLYSALTKELERLRSIGGQK